jgi:hypothetical protein
LGTMIHLALGRLEVDWGKNSVFSDHGPLFQADDLKEVPSYYASDDWPDGEPIIEMNEGFGKPLQAVKDRLELLGYTLRAVEHQYAELHKLHGLSEQPIPFDELRTALAAVDVTKISGRYSEDYEPGEFVREEILERLGLSGYPRRDLRPDHWEVSLLLENFGANAALRLLAENAANLALDVCWDFTPLVEAGWADRGEFRAGATADQRFLVVTEGSSDAKIISHALRLYRPHIADFFQFVDMEEGYPFSGTGNLHRFTQGLTSIGVLNNTIILYDNDAEGTAQLKRTRQLSFPKNLTAIKLPDLRELSHVDTIGPDGKSVADVNGKAAAIECYLDYDRPNLPPPVVRWTSYVREIDTYQGVLEHKTQYMRDFLDLRGPTATYRSDKITAVLDRIVGTCVEMAESKVILNHLKG